MHDEFEKQGEDGEVILRTHGDCWVVGRKSDEVGVVRCAAPLCAVLWSAVMSAVFNYGVSRALTFSLLHGVQREFFCILNQKNANLIEINGLLGATSSRACRLCPPTPWRRGSPVPRVLFLPVSRSAPYRRGDPPAQRDTLQQHFLC